MDSVRANWARNRMVQVGEPRATRIVCIGGGTGLPTVLRGLAPLSLPRQREAGLDLTAIVAMSDDGGSSGRLRRSLGGLPPGDVRNCLVALSGSQNKLKEVFQFRFDGAPGLRGHAVGNLFISAVSELKGDFLEAVRMASELLQVRGTVLPSTLVPVELIAARSDQTVVVGERNLCRGRGRVQRVELRPASPAPADGLLEAISQADLIALGPGSLYSSVISNLLVGQVAEALRGSRALKVLVGNLMTQPGETDGMSCAQHVEAILDHAGPIIDVVLHNVSEPSAESLERYAAQGSVPVEVDRRQLLRLGVLPVEADLLKEGARIRHDGRKVARCLVKLSRAGV